MTTVDFAPLARAVGRLGVRRALRLPQPWVSTVLVGYGIPVTAAVGAALTWFRPGGFVASGDVTPFVRENLASELLSSWNHQATGAGSSSYEIARAVEVGAIRLAELVGASEVAGQLLLFVACFAFAAFGAAYLAVAVVRHPAAVVAAGLLGAFNSFSLVNHPNPLPLVAVGLVGLLVGQLWRRGQGRRMSAIALAAATLPASYVALNPPLLALVAVSVGLGAAGASLFAGKGGSRRALGLLARALPLAALLNLWWIVPLGQLTLNGSGFDFTAETDVGAWAWSHVRNSIANVASLNAHWGWTHPEYFPYAGQLEEGPWPLLRWLLPAGAVAGVVLAGRRLRAGTVGLGLLAVALVFLGKGLHGPFAGVNAWLYEHVPGFWLLREPVSKVGVALVLVYAVLAAVACERAIDALAERRPALRRVGAVALAAVVAGALAYPWPLWTGTVVPADRGVLPGGHVQIPDDWRASAAAVNRSPVRGKALILPLSGYYQVTTTWGYHGADAVPQQLLTRPVLNRLPGGYFGNSAAVEALLEGVEDALLLGDTATARRLLQALGVSHVLVRRDLVSDTQTPAYAEPDRLRRGLGRLRDARMVASSPVVDVFELGSGGELVRAYSQLVGTGTDALAASVGGLPPEAAAQSGSNTVDAVRWTVSSRRADATFRLGRPGLYSVGRAASGTGLYSAAVTDTPTGAALELRDTAWVAVDGGDPRPQLLLQIPLESPAVRAVEIEERLLPLDGDGELLALRADDELRAYAAVRERSVLGAFSGLEDCNAHDERTPQEAGLSLVRDEGVVRLAARAHSACTWAPVGWASPSAAFELRLDYRVAHGAPARVCAWQDGPDRCVGLPTLPEGEGWQSYRAVFRQPAAADALRLYLYADGDVPGGTEVEYRDVRLVPLEPASPVTRLFPDGDAAGTLLPLTAGPHELRVAQDIPAKPLGPLSKLEDCGASDARTPAEAGLRLERLPGGGVELGAQAHVGCAWASTGATEPGAIYRVSFEHRTLSGRPARACVWQIGVGRCAELPEIVSATDWTRFAATFRPDPAASELRLYLYADGEEAGAETRVQYRKLALEPVVPATIAVAPAAAGPSAPPEVTWAEEGPDRYRVDVRDASGPFVLVLAESFAPGWSLRGLPSGWSAEHVEVDGYANGWRIHGRGSASVTLQYGPAATARLAASASLGSALGSVAFAVFFAARRRRRPTSVFE